jgi:hypothetical protein
MPRLGGFFVALGLLGSLLPREARSSALACDHRWHLQSTSDGHDNQFLNAVSALSVSDAWAFGDFADGIGTLQPLLEHWDGATWEEVPGGAIPDGLLSGGVALSSNDVWAVGGRQQSLPARTLTEHWDGSTWTVVPSPSPGRRDAGSFLQAVDATSSDDIWAVGSRGIRDGDSTLIERWDGSKWTTVPSANAPGMDTNILNSVTVVAADDIWAVGYAYSNTDRVSHTLTIHWDGTNWSVVPSPDGGTDGSLLYGVSGSSSTDVWLSGEYVDPIGQSHALTEHWDGSSWSVVPGADRGLGGFLYAISATPSGRTWAGGGFTTQNGTSLALADLWDGSRWQGAQVVSPGTSFNTLQGIDALSDSSVFAVGYFTGADFHAYDLAEYFC